MNRSVIALLILIPVGLFLAYRLYPRPTTYDVYKPVYEQRLEEVHVTVMENGQPVEKALTLKRPVVKYVNESRSLLPTLWQWIPFVAVCIALTTLVGLAAISLRQYASDQYHRREDPQAKRTEKQIGVVLKLVAPYLAGIVTMFPMTGSDVALKREIATLKEILNKPPEAAQQIGKDNYGPIPPGPKAALPDDPPVPQ